MTDSKLISSNSFFRFRKVVIYEIPSGADQFEMEVILPFGQENIFVYASTAALGEIKVLAAGGVYEIKNPSEKVRESTGAVALKQKSPGQKTNVAEFFEAQVVIKTDQ